MIGPMKKKVITSAVVTSIVLILVFAAIAYVYVSNTNKTIKELEAKKADAKAYVLTTDKVAGDVITASDILLVEIKNESAALDSYNEYSSISDMVGRRLKVNARQKTIITSSLFFEEDKEPELDTRLQEFNMITLPSDLEVGDYIDIRLRFPTGEDYSVLVGKKIEGFGALDSESNTIFLRLSEEEIVKMGSAIIESYITNGIKLYANKYVDPSTQLFDYENVDYVERFEAVRYIEVSGEMSGEVIEVERTVAEIASLIGLSEDETEDIRVALNENNQEVLSIYRNKVLTIEKSIIATYPVKVEVAALIQKNPNILDEIKAKYNVETLEEERRYFLETGLYLYERDINGEIMKDEDGNPILKRDENGKPLMNEDYINSVSQKLQDEISTQRSERQEYLINLLATQGTTAQ